LRVAAALPFSAALRLSDVAISRPALEAELGCGVDRYEPARRGTLYYAQLNLAIEDEGWPAIVDCLSRIGPGLQALRAHLSIGLVSLDLAIAFHDDAMTVSTTVPAPVADIVGRHGIDIELSVYLTSRDDEPGASPSPEQAR
jgi:hypothetical protein